MAVTSKVRRWALAVSTTGIAALVLLMAWPRLNASLHYLPVDRAVKRYWNAGAMDPDERSAMQQRAREAISIHDHYRYASGLGFLLYLQALGAEGTLNERRLAFEETISLAADSLGAAPVQPEVWLRMAHAGSQVFWPANDVVAATKMANLAGRVEPTHLMSRLLLGYALLEYLEDESTRLLRDQTVLAWALRQRDFERALKAGSLDPERIEAVLVETHPDLLAEIKESLDGSAR